MATADRITALLEPVIVDLGYELVGVDYRPHSGGGLLRLYVDEPERGIVLEDCERVSREVSALLDVEDPIPGHYTLEVSSPGIDRPLFKLEHYARFIGDEAKVNLIRPLDGRRRFRGVIEGVEDEHVILKQDGERFRLPFGDIVKANLVGQL